MDTLTAARLQMTLSLAFHMIFAAIGIGLPLLLVITEWRYLRTGKEADYLALARKWSKAIGLLFAIGAISGTALAFEIGLLWPHYMKIIGPAVGHLFGLEGFAFFIEAVFLGLYLYGWKRLKPWAHWFCGVIVAFSGAASGVLVLGVNSWMQQPVGATFQDGVVTSVDPFAVFKSYAWFTMAVHSTLACYEAVAFAAAAVYALGILRGRRDEYHFSALRIAMAVAAVSAILQPVSGNLLGKFVFQSQPAKFAAMEGQFKTESHAPLRLGGYPDEETRTTRYALEIPGGLSFLADGNPATTVKGLNDIPREHWPNLHLAHFSFQIMVGLGVILMLLSIWFWLAYWRKRAAALDSRLLLRALVASGSFGFIALEVGWTLTEAGRQPWVIQPNPDNGFPGMLTSHAVTPAGSVTLVFWAFAALYLALAVIVVVLLKGIDEHGSTVSTS